MPLSRDGFFYASNPSSIGSNMSELSANDHYMNLNQPNQPNVNDGVGHNLNRIPEAELLELRNGEYNCPICMNVINPNIQKTTCGHWFHEDCLSGWIKAAPTSGCPTCRQYPYTGGFRTKKRKRKKKFRRKTIKTGKMKRKSKKSKKKSHKSQ